MLRPLFEEFLEAAVSPPGPPRPDVQTKARAITESLRHRSAPEPVYPYPSVEQPNSVYGTPGKGVSGETRN